MIDDRLLEILDELIEHYSKGHDVGILYRLLYEARNLRNKEKADDRNP